VARANYQFAPGALALQPGSRALFADRFELAWASSVPVTAAIVHEGDDPSDGWIAPSLGVRERAPRLVLDFSATYPHVALLVVLADRQRGVGRGHRVTCERAGTRGADAILGARIAGPGWEDRLLAGPGGRAMRWEGIETDAFVCAVRSGPGGIGDVRRIGGSYVRDLAKESAGFQQEAMAFGSPAGLKC
jgi:hypothetical protein